MLPGASTSRESLDSRQTPQTTYRHYPGPTPSNGRSSPAGGASEAQAESDIEPESEDDAGHVNLPSKSSKSEDELMDHERVKSEADTMDMDIDVGSRSHTPALGRPKGAQLPLVFQTGIMSVGAFSPPSGGRGRQSHEKGLGSPQGELHCPVSWSSVVA
jgi:hypothetical protein